jgi:hypothetical protein
MSGNQNKNQGTQQPSLPQIIFKINEHAQALEQSMLIANQQQQVIDQYRIAIYNSELRVNLLIKMLEEKGIMVKEEFNQRWPLYLKNDVGVLGPDGKMLGELKVTLYGDK